MNKLIKKVNGFSLRKKTRKLETDAAPSRPRTQDEMDEESSSSSDEDDNKPEYCSADSQQQQSDTNEFPNNTFETKSPKGPFSQTNHIIINNGSNIHLGNNYTFNNYAQKPFSNTGCKMAEEEVPEHPSKPEPLTPKIEATFSNRETAEKEDFIAIKSDIGSNWRTVAEKLGLCTSDINQVYNRYKSRDSGEIFYHLMLKWKEVQSSSTTTVGILCKTLWYCNETAAATTLSKLYSSK